MELHVVDLRFPSPWLKWLDHEIAVQRMATRFLLQTAFKRFPKKRRFLPPPYFPQGEAEARALADELAPLLTTEHSEDTYANPLYALSSDLFAHDKQVWATKRVDPDTGDTIAQKDDTKFTGLRFVLILKQAERYIGHIYTSEPVEKKGLRMLHFIGIRKSLREIFKPTVKRFAWQILLGVALFAASSGTELIQVKYWAIGPMISILEDLAEAQSLAMPWLPEYEEEATLNVSFLERFVGNQVAPFKVAQLHRGRESIDLPFPRTECPDRARFQASSDLWPLLVGEEEEEESRQEEEEKEEVEEEQMTWIDVDVPEGRGSPCRRFLQLIFPDAPASVFEEIYAHYLPRLMPRDDGRTIQFQLDQDATFEEWVRRVPPGKQRRPS